MGVLPQPLTHGGPAAVTPDLGRQVSGPQPLARTGLNSRSSFRGNICGSLQPLIIGRIERAVLANGEALSGSSAGQRPGQRGLGSALPVTIRATTSERPGRGPGHPARAVSPAALGRGRRPPSRVTGGE